MSTAKHAITKDEGNSPNKPILEWKLGPLSGNNSSSFCLCYRKINTQSWTTIKVKTR